MWLGWGSPCPDEGRPLSAAGRGNEDMAAVAEIHDRRNGGRWTAAPGSAAAGAGFPQPPLTTRRRLFYT